MKHWKKNLRPRQMIRNGGIFIKIPKQDIQYVISGIAKVLSSYEERKKLLREYQKQEAPLPIESHDHLFNNIPSKQFYQQKKN